MPFNLVSIQARCACTGLRATAATNALDHEADIAKVQEWLGHASISTTRLYDRTQNEAGRLPYFQGELLRIAELVLSM